MWFWQKIDAILAGVKALQIQGKVMSQALDDLKSAVTDLGTAVTAGNAQIESELQTILNSGSSDADIEAAAASIRTIIQTQNDEVAKAKAALPPG